MKKSEARRRIKLFDDRVRAMDAEQPGYLVLWTRFTGVVLAHGGIAVVPRFEPDALITTYLEFGKIFDGHGAIIKAGAERECHLNSVALWQASEALAIGTGYALSDDGLWREHSWAWDGDDHLIETTEPRTSYFGLRLEGDDARRYAAWISGGDQ